MERASGNLLPPPPPPFIRPPPQEITEGIRSQWQTLPKTTAPDPPQTTAPGVPWAGICLQPRLYLAQPYEALRGEAKANHVGQLLKDRLFQGSPMTTHRSLERCDKCTVSCRQKLEDKGGPTISEGDEWERPSSDRSHRRNVCSKFHWYLDPWPQLTSPDPPRPGCTTFLTGEDPRSLASNAMLQTPGRPASSAGHYQH